VRAFPAVRTGRLPVSSLRGSLPGVDPDAASRHDPASDPQHLERRPRWSRRAV